MWKQKQSILLSIVCTRAVIAIGLVVSVGLPFLATCGFFAERYLIPAGAVKGLLVLFYLCAVPAFILLLTLDSLLSGIRQGLVFVERNVRLLRRISWCCFACFAILVVGGFYVSIVFVFLGVIAGFFGLILRVVKNVIQAAVALKDENDFTI
ncbi:MAG: DUF2975 domain-containing protein [Clostridiales Family XIII bacterium]|jgi:ABC-type multidrug transport system permease subunit|nr:DUF2975 domain-containing protein [Clostridiales Family XIII bacterium]